MNLTVKDVAMMLNVSNKTIYRMIKGETIPCFRVGGQWRFSQKEIKSWIEDVRAFTPNSFTSDKAKSEESIPLSEFISRGGIYDNIPGKTKQEAIFSCLRLIHERIPALINPDELYSSIMAREALCPTSVGHSIAFPHPVAFGRFTDVSRIALCRLDRLISFSSLDNEPVDTLFFIFPKNERRFLRIQAKLMRILRDDAVLSAIKSESDHGLVLKTVSEREADIFGSVTDGL